MRKAILTTYKGPTNYRGARVVARSEGNLMKMTQWDHALGSEENHEHAAMELMRKMGWDKYNKIIGGSTTEGYAWVQVEKEEEE